MSTQTLCDHPLLIGEMLRRADARLARRNRWRWIFRLRRHPVAHCRVIHDTSWEKSNW